MAISKPPGPSGGLAAVNRAVAHLMGAAPHAAAALGGAVTLKASQPVQVFVVGLNDIADEGFLRKAVPVGWRYLIVGNGPTAAAEVRATAQGGSAAFSQLIRGGLPERLRAAADLAAQQYEADPEEYEARILEIPSLYFAAVWLHGPKEIFFPFLEGRRDDTLQIREDPSFTKRVVEAAAAKKQH